MTTSAAKYARYLVRMQFTAEQADRLMGDYIWKQGLSDSDAAEFRSVVAAGLGL
jgi:hypothetical protein